MRSNDNNNRSVVEKISPPSSPSPSPFRSTNHGKYSSSTSSPLPMPNLSPTRKKLASKTVYGDRYIPNRNSVDISAAFSLNHHVFSSPLNDTNQDPESDLDLKRKQEANLTFSTILKAELFGDDVPSATPPSRIGNINRQYTSSSSASVLNNLNSAGIINNEQTPPRTQSDINTNVNDIDNLDFFGPSINNNGSSSHSPSNHHQANSLNNFDLNHALINDLSTRRRRRRSSITRDSPEKVVVTSPKSSSNLLTYKSPRKIKSTSTFNADVTNEIYSLSPVRPDSQRLLLSPQKKTRQISKVPYRVLDAPELADDFYLNLVDWSSQNILAVGLGSCVYLWDGVTGSVDRLCDLGDNNKITSLSWIGAGTHLAIGTNMGSVEVWDATMCRCTRTMTGHISRVGSLAWNEHILSSGSRDRSILNRDVRVPEHYINKLENFHRQEICGLRWNIEENKLASGGNDNKLLVWDGFNTSKPLHSFEEHTAAIKAISWNPHQRGILASGGGTADRRIKIWNTIAGTKLNDIDTGSQVCNLIWSKNSHELVSTHGYSKNQIVIWKYNQSNNSTVSPNIPVTHSATNNSYELTQIASLTGHTYRVLYLAMSPDGESIVTGAGDETLRFWKVFERNRNDNQNCILLKSFMQLR